MSTLWTPSGEHEPSRASDREAGIPPTGDRAMEAADEAEVAEELARVRAELARTPVADMVANHAIGLFQLALLHLAPDEGAPRLAEAGLAIDAMASLVDGLGDRLGGHAGPLRDALAQLRLAYVQASTEPSGAGETS